MAVSREDHGQAPGVTRELPSRAVEVGEVVLKPLAVTAPAPCAAVPPVVEGQDMKAVVSELQAQFTVPCGIIVVSMCDERCTPYGRVGSVPFAKEPRAIGRMKDDFHAGPSSYLCPGPRARVLGLALSAALLFVPRVSWGREVYLNGIKLDSSVLVQNQRFPGCDVSFDESGDVHIAAKDAKVAVKPISQKPTRRYWLTAMQTLGPDRAPFLVEVFINGTSVRQIRSSKDQVVLDVTRYVVVGDNSVRIVATEVEGGKRPLSAADSVLLVLGEGTVNEGEVSMDKTLVTYRRTALEPRTTSKDLGFTGR